MSKLMLSSSVLLKWIETPDGDKEYSDLFLMIDGLKDSILNVVKVQSSLGFADRNTQILQEVNGNIAAAVRNLEDLFEEMEDQFESAIQKGGER